MKLKEIKPGMAVHCKNNGEKKALLEEAERLGYRWYGIAEYPLERNIYSGMTIHFNEPSCICDYLNITWSDKTEGVTEFSDLIIPELSAEEAIEWFLNHFNDDEYKNAFVHSSITTIRKFMTPEEVVNKISEWKSDHEKKTPEIETFYNCRIMQIFPDRSRRCVHEEEAKADPYLPYGGESSAAEEILKRYCMEHDGEYIAVHEIVSRVKR